MALAEDAPGAERGRAPEAHRHALREGWCTACARPELALCEKHAAPAHQSAAAAPPLSRARSGVDGDEVVSARSVTALLP